MRLDDGHHHPLTADRFIAESMASCCDDFLRLGGYVRRGLDTLLRRRAPGDAPDADRAG